jgi:hypothetical protein
MRRFLARSQAWLIFVLTLLVCLAGAGAISLAAPLPADDEFDVVGWELRHVPGKWLYLTERFFGGRLSPAEEEERLGRFLRLTARISDLERSLASDEGQQIDELTLLRRERDALENDVEAIIEGRVTAVLEGAGLASSFPLFPDLRWVFPPVDFEFDQPLRVLTVSPRDRIERGERRALRLGLTLEEAIELEAMEERDGERSALAEPVGGAATYPSIIAPRADYGRLVEIVAHEWVHQFLFFKPLGIRYFLSVELTTLNETVADLAGRELAALVLRAYPLAPDLAAQLDALRPPAPTVDGGAVLRQLRLDVEALLGRGEVEAAEALMEQRREELAAQGVVYRRINQAFFAARAVYADSPASIDPIGPKMTALREQSGSVGAFLRAAARLTSAAGLDRLLAGER